MAARSASSELVYFTERGSGPPLLRVHGLMVTGEVFDPVIDHFARRRRVIVPDLRGHGRSRALPPPYTVPRLATDQGLKQLGGERRDWLVSLIASQDRTLMSLAWKETMAFDSRRRLGEIACPTLVVAGSNDEAVPIHHARMLHDGIRGSRLVIIDRAGHALIWTHTTALLRVTDEFLDS